LRRPHLDQEAAEAREIALDPHVLIRSRHPRPCKTRNFVRDRLRTCSKRRRCNFIAVSFRLEVGEFDDLAPLLGLVGNELAEFGR
jgi:hypothetical protein